MTADPDLVRRRLADLAQTVRAERELLSYPNRPWVAPRVGSDGHEALDVLVVGGAQSGLVIAHGLARDGVGRVAVLDRAPAGYEGVWKNFARMAELRTPKILNGMDFGQPSLSVQRWFATRYGDEAWEKLGRIPRLDWAAYLAWYRETLSIPVENDTEVTDIRDGGDGLVAVETRVGGEMRLRHASVVVIATGFDGAGAWTVPAIITENLPPDRYDHSNGPIDFSRLKGARIGIIGHAASAFDNAVAALKAGAASVDLLFRRPVLPTVNPHRHIETAGLMSHYPLLSDLTRWRIARHFRAADQPPTAWGYEAAHALSGFKMHPASPVISLGILDGAIRLETPNAVFRFDHLIAATGARINMEARPEYRTLAPLVARWGDRFSPPAGEEHEINAAHPYLGPTYAFQPRERGADWVERVFAFNALGFVSQGPHSTSISGHRHAVPRVLRGITTKLFLDQEAGLVDRLQAYDEHDLIP